MSKDKKELVKVLPPEPAQEKRGRVEVSQEIAAPISLGKVEGFALVAVVGDVARKRNKVYTVEGPESKLGQVAELAKAVS